MYLLVMFMTRYPVGHFGDTDVHVQTRKGERESEESIDNESHPVVVAQDELQLAIARTGGMTN